MKLRTIAAMIMFALGVFSVSTPVAAEETEGPADCGSYQEEYQNSEPNCGSDGELPEERYVSGEDGLGCPEGWAADGPNQLCYQVDSPAGGDDELCDYQWVDVIGGVIDSVCLDPTGYEDGQVYYEPTNLCHSGGFVVVIGMSNYFECVGPDYGAEEPVEEPAVPVDDESTEESETPVEPVEEPKDSDFYESGTDTGSTDEDKGVYPVIGTAYVVGTGGQGVVCRDAPNGAPVITLAEGTPVSQLADGVSDGWQMVSYQASDVSFPSCFVSAKYLGDSPMAVEVEVVEVIEDTNVEETKVSEDTTDASATAETALVAVDGMPSTGHGTMFEQQSYGQDLASQPRYDEEPRSTPEQREIAATFAVLCGIILVVYFVCQLIGDNRR